MLAAYLSTLEGGSGQNAADAMQVMLNRATQNHSGYGTNVGNQAMAEGQFTPFSAAIYGPGLDPGANAAYGHIAPMLGNTPEERKAKLRQIAATEGFAGLDRIFNKNKASEASAILSDFQSGGAMSTAARNDVKGRAYFKGQTDLQNMRSGDMYRGTGGNYFHDDRDLSQLPVGMLQNVSPDPEPPKMSGLTPTQADMDWYNQQMGFSTTISKPGAEKQEPPGASPRRNLMQEVAPSFIGPPAPTVTKPELGPQSIPLGRRPPQQPGS